MKNNINFSTVKFIVNSLIDLLRYGGWQILFFIVFIKYKEDVRNIFIFASKHISKLTVDKLSFEFENDVDKVQKRVEKNSGKLFVSDSQNSKSFEELVSLRPDYAILDSWKNVEFELQKLYPGKRPQGRYIMMVKRDKLLNDEDYTILKELMILKNKVIHETQIIISSETAKKYRNQCLYIIKKLEENRES